MEKLTAKEKVLVRMVLKQKIESIRQKTPTNKMATDLEKAMLKILPLESDKKIKPCVEATSYSCDEVAECMKVSKELRAKLWDVMPAKEKVSAEDCGSRCEWSEINGTLVSQNWDNFTNEERIELNKVLKESHLF